MSVFISKLDMDNLTCMSWGWPIHSGVAQLDAPAPLTSKSFRRSWPVRWWWVEDSIYHAPTILLSANKKIPFCPPPGTRFLPILFDSLRCYSPLCLSFPILSHPPFSYSPRVVRLCWKNLRVGTFTPWGIFSPISSLIIVRFRDVCYLYLCLFYLLKSLTTF